MQNDFIKALFPEEQTHKIEVTFLDGAKAIYTMNVLNLLMSDKSVVEIIDMETGELLKY